MVAFLLTVAACIGFYIIARLGVALWVLLIGVAGAPGAILRHYGDESNRPRLAQAGEFLCLAGQVAIAWVWATPVIAGARGFLHRPPHEPWYNQAAIWITALLVANAPLWAIVTARPRPQDRQGVRGIAIGLASVSWAVAAVGTLALAFVPQLTAWIPWPR